MDLPTWSLSDSSAEESTGKGEVPSLAQPALSQPSQALPQKCDAGDGSIYPSSDGFPALLYEVLDHQDIRAHVKNTNGSDLKEPVGVPDRVGVTCLLDGLWY